MAKQVIITHCNQCHHQIKYMVLCGDGYEIVDSATCKLTNTKLEYMYYNQFKLKPELAFSKDCPLGDA